MKNCSPVLRKNLEPFASIVAMEETRTARANRPVAKLASLSMIEVEVGVVR